MITPQGSAWYSAYNLYTIPCEFMPSNIASESGGKSVRHADMSAKHLEDTLTKFPNGYNESAKYHHNTLKAQNKNKLFRTGSYDHYLLNTFFPDQKTKSEEAAKSQKSPNPKSAAKTAESADKPASPSASEAPSASASEDEDTSVRRVSTTKSKADEDLQKRAAEDDVPQPELDIVADPKRRPVVDMDADTVLGKDQPGEDTPENNAKIAEVAISRNARNRMSASLLKAAKERRASATTGTATSGRKRKRPAAEGDSDNSDDERAARKSAKSRARKSRESREVPETGSDTSEDDATGARKSRFMKRADSEILVGYASEIEKIRPLFQRMLLQRDGSDIRDGAPHRVLNFNAILSVAGTRLNRETYKQFRKACMESWNDPQDA